MSTPTTREEAANMAWDCLVRKHALMKESQAFPHDSPEYAQKWRQWRELRDQQRHFESLAKFLPETTS